MNPAADCSATYRTTWCQARARTPRRLPWRQALLFLLLAVRAVAGADPRPDQQLRSAYVPADARTDWPAGDWTPVPMPLLQEFLQDEADRNERVRPTAYLEQARYRGTLAADFTLEGTWTASVRCPDGSRPLIEFGSVSPVLSELKWGDVPAVWGLDPFGRTQLYADHPAGDLSGRWSLAGRSIIDRVEFQVRLPPSATSQCDITLPAGWRLRSSAGTVREPQPAEQDGQSVWTIDLGQHSQCLWTLQKPDTGAAPQLVCDRTITYTLRPDGNSLQAEFSVQAFDQSVAEITFLLPAGLSNPTVTYAATTNLTFRVVPDGDLQRLVVPVPGSEPGRLGTFRVVADLSPNRDEDAPLPVVSLDGAEILRGTRRVDIDHPLTLKSLDLDGLRQSAVNSGDLVTDWLFEELRPDGRIVVRVGRPQTLLTSHVATHIEWTDEGPRFHSVVSLQARTGSTFRTHFQLPPGCDIVDVFASGNIEHYLLSRWRVSEARDSQTLTVEFRQALQVQSPKQFEITGRWTNTAPRLRVPAFPLPLEADDWQILLAINPGPNGTVSASGASLRSIAGGQIPSDLLPHRLALGLLVSDPALTWFTADGASPAGEIVIDPTAAAAPPPIVATGTQSGAKGASAVTPVDTRVHPALSLDLHTLIPLADSAPQRHEARYALPGATAVTEWTFDLPDPAVLDAVLVNGRGHPAEILDRTVKLAPLLSDTREILVRYRTPATSGAAWLRRRYEVPLPHWNVPVVNLKWTVELPEGRAVDGCPLGTPVGSFAASPSWLQRMFTPWIRSTGTPWFNPLSGAAWRHLLTAPEEADGSSGDVTFVSLEAPSKLTLDTWNARAAHRVAQVLLLACLASVVVIRRMTNERPRVFVGTAAVVLVITLCLPEEFAPFGGGVLLGLVGGGIMPARWVQQRDLLSAWQPRHRSVLASSAGSVVLVAGLAVWYSPARSQEPRTGTATATEPAQTPVETRTEQSGFDVLIPYRESGVTTVGYVETRAMSQFTAWLQREHELPPYLLRTVQYQISDSDPALIRAVLDVVVLSDARRVAVILPFREIAFRSPDDCEVDGRRTQVRPAADGMGLIVDVEPARPTTEIEADPRTTSLQRQVEIAVWFRMVGGNAGAEYRCRVPPVIDARLHLPAAAVRRGWRLSWAQGGRRGDGRGDLDCDVGGTDWIRIDGNSDENADGIQRSPLCLDATTLAEVHPMRVQLRTRLDVSPRSEETGLPLPRRLNVLLPGRAEVRQVSAELLREFNVWHAGSAVTVLEIDFRQPLAVGQKIEFDYAIPFNPQVAAELPAIPLVAEGQLLSHHIGLRAAPGMTLEPDRAALAAGRLQEQLPDWFRASLSPDMAWPSPDAAFAALKPTAIPFRLTPLEPDRSVAMEQSVTIESHSLRLATQAHLEISRTHVFEHQLLVPPDLRIDEVSVKQDGANRMLDWSRDGERVVVHLREGRSGQQLLELRGWLPLQVGEVTRFPALVFQGATIRSSELILRNTSGQRVELFADGGVPVLPGFPPPDAATDAAVKRYAGSGSTLPVSCRVAVGSVPPQVQSIAQLLPRDRDLDFTMTCRFEQQSDEPSRDWILRVPRELARQFQVTPADIVRASQVTDDGALEMRLQWPDAGTAHQVLQMSTSLPLPRGEHWTLPLPVFSGLTSSQRLLELSPELPYVPEASTAVPVESGDLINGQPEPLVPAISGGRSYRITADRIELVKTGGTPSVPAAPAFVETVVWDRVDGSADGLTVVYFSNISRPIEFAVELPDTAHVQLVLDGDQVVETGTAPESSVNCAIPGNDASGIRRVAFLWRRQVAGSGRLLTATDQVPTLQGLTVGRHFVIVVPPHGQQYVLRDKAKLERSDVYRLERSEQLLQLIGGHGAPGASASAANVLELARSLDKQIAALSGTVWNDSPYARRYAALRTRWNAVRQGNWLESDANAPADSGYRAVVDGQLQLASEALSNPDAMPLRLEHAEQRLVFWNVHKQFVRAACGILFALALRVLLIAWRNLRRRWPSFDFSLPADYVGLVLFGLFWWFALRFGPLGLVIAFVAAVLQVAAWLRKTPEPVVSLQ